MKYKFKKGDVIVPREACDFKCKYGRNWSLAQGSFYFVMRRKKEDGKNFYLIKTLSSFIHDQYRIFEVPEEIIKEIKTGEK